MGHAMNVALQLVPNSRHDFAFAIKPTFKRPAHRPEISDNAWHLF
jgi:hypothetical protein